jgi:hypothetical protein
MENYLGIIRAPMGLCAIEYTLHEYAQLYNFEEFPPQKK